MGVIRNATNGVLKNLAFLFLVFITSPALIVASVIFPFASSVSTASVSGTVEIEVVGGGVISVPVPDTYEFSGAATHVFPFVVGPAIIGIPPNLNVTYNR